MKTNYNAGFYAVLRSVCPMVTSRLINQFDPIVIEPTPFADSRCLTVTPDITDVAADTKRHICAVHDVLTQLGSLLRVRGLHHDYTKVEFLSEFHTAMQEAIENGKKFTESDWYKRHTSEERHHLQFNPPEDVNLLDVLEYLADFATASKARKDGFKGSYVLSEELLMNAVNHTYDMIYNALEVDSNIWDNAPDFSKKENKEERD